MPKQDLRIIKTKKQLECALLSCLRSTPFQKLTVEQLCQEALINRSTFYSYYQDKEDFLQQFIEQQLSAFKEKVDVSFILAKPMHIHDQVYMESFHTILYFIYESKQIFLTLWEAEISRKIYDEMVEIIQEKLLATLQSDNKYASLYASLFASDMLSMIRWGLQHPDTIAAAELEEIMAANMRIGMFKSFKQFTKQNETR